MQGRVTQEIRELLAEAENSGACLATRSRRIREALERRVADGTLVSPLPLLYVDRELWLGLTETQRTLHLMRGIHTLHPSWVFCGTSAAVATPRRVYRSGLPNGPLEVGDAAPGARAATRTALYDRSTSPMTSP